MRIASWAIDVAATQGFIHAKYLDVEGSKECQHAGWVEDLIDQLITKSGRIIAVAKPDSLIPPPDLRFSRDPPHFPIHLGSENNRKMCKVCYKTSNKPTKTFYACEICGVGLCISPCFKVYHTDTNF